MLTRLTVMDHPRYGSLASSFPLLLNTLEAGAAAIRHASTHGCLWPWRGFIRRTHSRSQSSTGSSVSHASMRCSSFSDTRPRPGLVVSMVRLAEDGFRARTRVADAGVLTCDDRKHHGDDQRRDASQRRSHRTVSLPSAVTVHDRLRPSRRKPPQPPPQRYGRRSRGDDEPRPSIVIPHERVVDLPARRTRPVRIPGRPRSQPLPLW
jgi:hypothetical protein